MGDFIVGRGDCHKNLVIYTAVYASLRPPLQLLLQPSLAADGVTVLVALILPTFSRYTINASFNS